MKKNKNNFAFIDGQNLYLGIKELGWKLDYKRFRKYLADKYSVNKVFIFLGYKQTEQDLYTWLQDVGYICVFKPTLVYENGRTKGNCDAELVLHAMLKIEEFDKAIVITGDGDFHCLVKHLIKVEKLEKLLVPNQGAYSALLKRFPSEFLAFVSALRKKVEYKKKRTP